MNRNFFLKKSLRRFVFKLSLPSAEEIIETVLKQFFRVVVDFPVGQAVDDWLQDFVVPAHTG